MRHRVASLSIFAGVILSATTVRSQTLETETARLLPKGSWSSGVAFEFQTSADGKEAAIPIVIEYGIANRLELMLEPVPYTVIRPGSGRHATGAGDLEATGTFLMCNERNARPALALGLEAKVPSAEDSLIGTGETDYAGYLIGSKQLRGVDLHANVSYTVVGSPPGVSLNNIWGFALAGVYHPVSKVEVFGEVLGNTTSAPAAPSNASGENTVIAEAAGGELSGTLGAGRMFSKSLLLFFAVSYDNNRAVLLRPGLTFKF